MPDGARTLDGHHLGERLGEAMPGAVVATTDQWVEVDPARVAAVLQWLHDDGEIDAAQLSNLCAVDRNDRFEVVYHLQSLDHNHRLVVKAVLDDHDEPSIPSVYDVYRGALLQEREVYDLMGVHFDGHPDLRRLLLWEGFPGHPLRKDFMQVEGHHPGLPGFPYEQPDQPVR